MTDRRLVVDKSKPNSIKEKVACGTLHISVNSDSDGKIRFFFNTSKGACDANLRAIASLLTILYNEKRNSNEDIISDLQDIVCKATMRWKGELKAQGKKDELAFHGNSCPNVISRILKELDIKEKK